LALSGDSVHSDVRFGRWRGSIEELTTVRQ
jgi:hypothetical protein